MWLFSIFAELSVVFSYKNNNIIVIIITKALGKRATFTGRSPIYQHVIENFVDYCFLGSGRDYIKNMFCETHNVILQILYYGGFFSLILFIWLISELTKKVKQCNNISSNIIFISFYSFMICGLMESVYDKPAMWFLIGLLIRLTTDNNFYHKNANSFCC